MAKDKDYKELIGTTRWLKLRRDTLSKQPLCVECEAEGIITPATELHHVTPVENGINRAEKIRLMYDPHNLRPLCHDHHVRVHTELGRSGKAATTRRNKEQVARIEKKFFGDEPGEGFLIDGARR